MTTIKSLVIIGAVALMTSCASVAKFPVSKVTPAADITAKTKKKASTIIWLPLQPIT